MGRTRRIFWWCGDGSQGGIYWTKEGRVITPNGGYRRFSLVRVFHVIGYHGHGGGCRRGRDEALLLKMYYGERVASRTWILGRTWTSSSVDREQTRTSRTFGWLGGTIHLVRAVRIPITFSLYTYLKEKQMFHIENLISNVNVKSTLTDW
jgi:hypothetical protein